ncbi:DUF6703 family protein [Dactylosporangium sp. NPDC000555]|uniref:DUF6703 family protein n=1 Tax=Dactylosporangium sp. NPDC000555 TaxID=3154260 RepID=UPI003322B47A
MRARRNPRRPRRRTWSSRACGRAYGRKRWNMTERVLNRLARLNRTLVFLMAAVAVFAGLLLPGIVGAAVLLLLAAGLIWVLSRTWAVTPMPMRVIRVLILTLLLVAAAYKAS